MSLEDLFVETVKSRPGLRAKFRTIVSIMKKNRRDPRLDRNVEHLAEDVRHQWEKDNDEPLGDNFHEAAWNAVRHAVNQS